MKSISLKVLGLSRIGMYLLISFVYYTLLPRESISDQILLIACFSILLINHFLLMRILVKDKYKIYLIIIDLLIATIYGVLYSSITNMYIIMFGIIIITLFLMDTTRKIKWIYCLTIAVIWLFITAYFSNGSWLSSIITFSYVIHSMIVGDLIKRLINAKDTIDSKNHELALSNKLLKEANQQLSQYSQQVENLSKIKERNHIAREVHDIVGHKMAAFLMQVRVAKELASIDSKKSSLALENAEKLAGEALHDVRMSVRTLKDDNISILGFRQELSSLIDQFTQMVGMQTNLHIQGDSNGVPISIQPSIFRVIQEGLTNAHNHGGASNCDITIVIDERNISITITDNGRGVEFMKPSFGIISMRERIESLGGTIIFHTEKEEGFLIEMKIPLTNISFKGGVT